MYYELDEKQMEFLERIKEKCYPSSCETKGNFITVENLWGIIEDLYDGIEDIEEKFNDYKEQIESPSEYYEETW